MLKCLRSSLILMAFLSPLFFYPAISSANSIKKELTDYQHANKLKICLWDSNEISIVNMNSLEATPLMGNWGTNYSFAHCALFHGGRFIAYSLSSYFIKQSTIKIFDTLNGETKDLISSNQITGFAVSPNEKEIAFVTDMENRKIDINIKEGFKAGAEIVKERKLEQLSRSKYQSLYVVDVNTKGLRKIIENDVFSITNTAWSPDGNKIIYESGEGDYYVYNFSTSSSKKILAENAFDLSWSSDSDRIYYRTYNESDANYYSISTDGLDKKLFLENKPLGWLPMFSDREIATPLYSSPDGKLILYGRYSGLKDYPLRIYAMDMKTKDTIALGYGSVGGWSFSDESRFFKEWPDNG